MKGLNMRRAQNVEVQAVQFVFDPKAENSEKVQLEINQCIANGFVVLACPTVNDCIYYQLARQISSAEAERLRQQQ